jgi:hypothetical protein
MFETIEKNSIELRKSIASIMLVGEMANAFCHSDVTSVSGGWLVVPSRQSVLPPLSRCCCIVPSLSRVTNVNLLGSSIKIFSENTHHPRKCLILTSSPHEVRSRHAPRRREQG